jgi:hypothetical protein
MNTTDGSSPVEIPAAELQHLRESLSQLSPEQLQALADFAAYLADAEGEVAAQALLKVPGLLDRIKQNRSDS